MKDHKVIVKYAKSKASGRFVKTRTAEEKRLRHNKNVMSWHKIHPEYRKNYRLAHLEKYLLGGRNNNLLRKYGITLEEKIKLIKDTLGKCNICGKKIDEVSGKLDHDHKTHSIRGILCNNCNAGLGMFRDDAQLLNKAIGYLERRVR